MKLIYCHARSGSSELVKCMREYSTPGQEFYDEPFKGHNAKKIGYRGNLLENGHLEDYIKFLDPHGAKHLWSDMETSFNHRLVSNKHIESILFLYRRDVSDYAISMVTARLTDEWHIPSVEHYGDVPVGHLLTTAEEFIKEVPNNARLVREYSNAPVACVAYEDLYGFNGLRAQRDATTTAFSALGITDRKYVAKCMKTTLSPERKHKTEIYYEKLFDNYGQARSKLDNMRTYLTDNPSSCPESILTRDR